MPEWKAEVDLYGKQTLRDRKQLGIVCEHLWQGLNTWAQDHGYQFFSQERMPF